MLMKVKSAETFSPINRAYNAVFRPGRLSVGLVVPIESYPKTPVPAMTQHIERVQLAEALGFPAVWLRDVPFNVPSFGDAGQIYDPFVYLGALAASTRDIALGVASIVLPLRHPAQVAKAAASVDHLSQGRLLMGIASGDRPEEFPAMNASFAGRGALFRDSYDYIRSMGESRPRFANSQGAVAGDLDMLPKPVAGRLPLLVTGASRQDPSWIAEHSDGWMTYPRSLHQQAQIIEDFRDRIAAAGMDDKPVMEPLYLDLTEDPDEAASPIHLGFRMGVNTLRDYLESRRRIGVNHVALNLRFNRAAPEDTLRQLAENLELSHREGTES
ncbi:MAG: LLM class oxidoreductase [Pseudomonadota bacterium]